MEKMDLTVEELRSKILELILDKLPDDEPEEEDEEIDNWFLEEKELNNAGITFGLVRRMKDEYDLAFHAYFICSDGIAKSVMWEKGGKYHLYYDDLLEKIKPDGLNNFSASLNIKKEEIEILTKEIVTYEKILESQKLRGLFAKLKHSN